MKNKKYSELTNDELLKLKDSSYNKYKRVNNRNLLSMGVGLLLILLPFGIIYSMLIGILLIGVISFNVISSTRHFYKYINAVKELKKKGYTEVQICNELKTITDEQEDILESEKIEEIPMPEIEDMAKEFSDTKTKETNNKKTNKR